MAIKKQGQRGLSHTRLFQKGSSTWPSPQRCNPLSPTRTKAPRLSTSEPLCFFAVEATILVDGHGRDGFLSAGGGLRVRQSPVEDLGGSTDAVRRSGALDGDGLKGEFPEAGRHVAAALFAGHHKGCSCPSEFDSLLTY